MKLLKKYNHLLLILYFPFYLAWFMYLEKTVTADSQFHVIYMKLDDYIPFCEYFIIPYLLWFAYIAIVWVFMAFKDRDEFIRMCIFLYIGMTVFLIVSTVYPNGHLLRPTEFERDNIFTRLCAHLYSTDTATNLFPSIHVFNSVGVHIAVMRSRAIKHNLTRILSGILMVSIVLSTVFLKQHSIFDVITAFVTIAILYVLIYVIQYKPTVKTAKKTA